MVETRRLIELGRGPLANLQAAPAGPLVVALSGGADSATAAWASVTSGRPTRAIHVHHGLASSDTMASAARDVGAALGIPVEVVTIVVPPGSSFESTARELRHKALGSRLVHGEWVVTGHTRDDQVETVLMRLVRGTGLDGLAGIRAVRAPYLRPLLDVSRSATREIATLAGLAWRDDPTNVDPTHLRNRIRGTLLPAIEATFGTAPATSLARMSALVGADINMLDDLAAAVPRSVGPGRIQFALGSLAAVPRALAARVVRSAFIQLDPPYPPVMRVLEAVLDLADNRGSSVNSGAVVANVSGPWLVLSVDALSTTPAPATLQVPGSGVWGRFSFDVSVHPTRPPMPLSSWALVMPYGGVETLRVRAAVREDVIAISQGHKEVFEALAEASVPVSERGRFPVVLADDRVVWLPGVRRAVWASGESERYLCVMATEDAG